MSIGLKRDFSGCPVCPYRVQCFLRPGATLRMTKRSFRKPNRTPIKAPVKRFGKLRQWIGSCGTGLTRLVKVLLILVVLRVVYCLNRLWPRLLHIVDLMVVGWTMMLQLMEQSGLAGDFQVMPDLKVYIARVNNRTWPLCRD